MKQTCLVSVGAMVKVPVGIVDMKRLKKDLTIPRKFVQRDMMAGVYDNTPEEDIPDPELYEWDETSDGKHVLVPRRYKIPYIGDVSVEYVDVRPAPRKQYKILSKNINLKDNQLAAANSIVKDGKLVEGILSLGCGRGKTVCALWMISQLKSVGQVLVCVPDGGVASQWRDRIEQFLEVEGGVGIIGDGEYDVNGRGIVIGIVNSLAQKSLPQSEYDRYTHVIIDESHTTATPTNRNIYRRFSGHRLALDATPNRADGQGKILRLHIGPILHEDLRPEVPATAYLVETGVISKKDPLRWRNGQGWPTPQDWFVLSSALSKDTIRNRIILDTVQSAVDKGRNILVLGKEVTQLGWLTDQLNARKRGTAACLVGSGSRRVKMDERTRVLDSYQVVCATQSLAKRALDKKTLDTLFIVVPFTDHNMVRQAVGRIQRYLDNKRPCMVVVFVDCGNPTAARVKDKLVNVMHDLYIEVKERTYQGDASTVKVLDVTGAENNG